MNKVTLEDWNYIYQKSLEVVKSKLKKKGIVINSELFEEMVFNTTTEYFKEISQNGKKISSASLFSYLWSLSNRTSLRWSMQILENDHVYVEKPKPFPINITRLQAQTPLGHLVFASITPKSNERNIRRIFHKFVRVRSFPVTPDLVSPYHSNIPVADWIQNRLCDFGLYPKDHYYIYKWGIATEDFDPREYGLYRTEKIIDTVQIKIKSEKQLLLNFQ